MIIVDEARNTIKNIAEKCMELDVIEKRKVDEGYCELVFRVADLDKWEKIIADALGEAVKPSGVKPAGEDLSITDQYGGIAANQTLFKREYEGGAVIAMLWPWDEEYVTLKVAHTVLS